MCLWWMEVVQPMQTALLPITFDIPTNGKRNRVLIPNPTAIHLSELREMLRQKRACHSRRIVSVRRTHTIEISVVRVVRHKKVYGSSHSSFSCSSLAFPSTRGGIHQQSCSRTSQNDTSWRFPHNIDTKASIDTKVQGHFQHQLLVR